MAAETGDLEPRCPGCGGPVKPMSRRLQPVLIVVTACCPECNTVWNFNYELTIVERAP